MATFKYGRGLTEAQEAEFQRFAVMPGDQWPQALQKFVTEATAPPPHGPGQSGEAVYDAIAEYVRRIVR